MEIQLNHRQPRDETRQTAFVTISGINAQVYKIQVGNVPIELDTDEAVLVHLNSRSEELHFFCLGKTYPGYDISEFKINENTDLEAFQEWIEAGCKNRILIGHDEETDEPIYKEEVITNHTYAGNHPLRYPPSDEMIAKALEYLDKVEKMDYEDLKKYIEDKITTLPKARDYLVELSQAFLALVKLVDSK